MRQEHQHYRNTSYHIFLYSKDLRLFGVVPLTSLLIAEENTPPDELIIEDFPVVDVCAAGSLKILLTVMIIIRCRLLMAADALLEQAAGFVLKPCASS